MPKPNQNKDTFRQLKAKAYVRAFLPEKSSLSDFVLYAKTYLAVKTNTLMNDPVFDKYTDEEILIEYFTHLFITNKDFRAEYETGTVDDFASWAEGQSDAAPKPEEFEFTPEAL